MFLSLRSNSHLFPLTMALHAAKGKLIGVIGDEVTIPKC